MGSEDSRTNWHLSKSVPITLLFAIAMQTLVSVWWARGQVAIDEDHEKRLMAVEKAREGDRLSERIAVLEVKLAQVLAATQEISQRLRAGDKQVAR